MSHVSALLKQEHKSSKRKTQNPGHRASNQERKVILQKLLREQLCHKPGKPAVSIRTGQEHQDRCLQKEGAGRISDTDELTGRYTLIAEFETN